MVRERREFRGGLRRLWPVVLGGMLGFPASPAVAALDSGRPACDYCRMILGEPGFGGQVATRSGRRLIYDSVECLAAAVLTDSVRQRDITAISFKDIELPHSLIPFERAVLAHCAGLESPMGLSLFAQRKETRPAGPCPDAKATRLDWRGVLERVNAKWFGGSLDVAGHLAAPPARAPARPAKR